MSGDPRTAGGGGWVEGDCVWEENRLEGEIGPENRRGRRTKIARKIRRREEDEREEEEREEIMSKRTERRR